MRHTWHAAPDRVVAATDNSGLHSSLYLSTGCLSHACLQTRFVDHPVRQLSFWQSRFALALQQRVFTAPAELIEYIELDNFINDYPQRIRVSQNTELYIDPVQQAMAGIPRQIRALFDDWLAGIFIVEGLGTTGYTEYISNTMAEPSGGFIVLDAALLERPANHWASWKDSTAFAAQADFQIRVTLVEPDDTIVNAIQYILLHELGHVLAIGGQFHPDWWLAPDRARFAIFLLPCFPGLWPKMRIAMFRALTMSSRCDPR